MIGTVGHTVIDFKGPLVPQGYSQPLFKDFGYVTRGNTINGEEFALWHFLYQTITNEALFQLSSIQGRSQKMK